MECTKLRTAVPQFYATDVYRNSTGTSKYSPNGCGAWCWSLCGVALCYFAPISHAMADDAKCALKISEAAVTGALSPDDNAKTKAAQLSRQVQAHAAAGAMGKLARRKELEQFIDPLTVQLVASGKTPAEITEALNKGVDVECSELDAGNNAEEAAKKAYAATGVSPPTQTEKQTQPKELNATNQQCGVNESCAWVSYAGIGAQFLPDYGEDGRSSGLNKQVMFALLTVDGRLGEDCGYRVQHLKKSVTQQATGGGTSSDHKTRSDAKETKERDATTGENKTSTATRTGRDSETEDSDSLLKACAVGPWHTGVTLTLMGSPVKREDKKAIPNEFNDVANTVTASLYLYWPMLQAYEIPSHPESNEALTHNFGPLLKAGAISRESLGKNGDSVNWFYSLGTQYTWEGYRKQDDKDLHNTWNGVPHGFIRVSGARFEDYAGFGRATRLVTEAALRIVPSLDLYLGFQGNFGKGPDEVAVILSFARTPQQFADLFGGLLSDKKEEKK